MRKIIIQIITLGILITFLVLIKSNIKYYFFQKNSPVQEIEISDTKNSQLKNLNENGINKILERPNYTVTSKISNSPLYFNNKTTIKTDSQYLVGTGKETYSITGHYQEYTTQYFVSPGKPRFVTCKGFEITNGDPYFISEYNKHISKIDGKTIINLDYMELDTSPTLLKSIYTIGAVRENENIMFNIKVNSIPDRQIIPCDNYGLNIDKINGDTRQTHRITGYFTPYERLAYPMDYNPMTDPQPETLTCQAFAVLNGDIEFLLTYEARNHSNAFTQKDKRMININIDEISPSEYVALTNSNPKSLVTLSVREREPAGKGCEMNCCSGPVDIVNIEK